MFGDRHLLHGAHQSLQRQKDDLAKLNPEKENKNENHNGGKNKYKRNNGKFGFRQRRIIPDE